MEEQVNRLAEKVWNRFQDYPSDRRFMIAIGGIPGSGKTTLASTIAARLNQLHATQSAPDATTTSNPIAIYVPMDGFHLTRAQLSAMPDPTTAHARRGAEFTFDGAAYAALIERLAEPIVAAATAAGGGDTGGTTTVYAPSFDHAVKDPVADDIAIEPGHRLVVIEGNYLLMDRSPWREAAALTAERWFVQVDFAVARRRLVRRHVAAGLCDDAEAAGRRADESDLLNGEEIVRLRIADVDEVVVSREDGNWVHD